MDDGRARKQDARHHIPVVHGHLERFFEVLYNESWMLPLLISRREKNYVSE